MYAQQLAPPAGASGRAGRGMGRGPALRSPEISSDHKVTFRLRAPKATEVVLNGDWPEGRNIAMTKDDAGTWSATVGPLNPELWSYTFSVDGVSVLDPSDANHLRDGTRYSNFFIIEGPLSENYIIHDVPHGNVSEVWYPSPTLPAASPRRMYVYTPAGYDTGKQRYPVLYLLHGAGGDDAGGKHAAGAELHGMAKGRSAPGACTDTATDPECAPAADRGGTASCLDDDAGQQMSSGNRGERKGAPGFAQPW